MTKSLSDILKLFDEMKELLDNGGNKENRIGFNGGASLFTKSDNNIDRIDNINNCYNSNQNVVTLTDFDIEDQLGRLTKYSIQIPHF